MLAQLWSAICGIIQIHVCLPWAACNRRNTTSIREISRSPAATQFDFKVFLTTARTLKRRSQALDLPLYEMPRAIACRRGIWRDRTPNPTSLNIHKLNPFQGKKHLLLSKRILEDRRLEEGVADLAWDSSGCGSARSLWVQQYGGEAGRHPHRKRSPCKRRLCRCRQ